MGFVKPYGYRASKALPGASGRLLEGSMRMCRVQDSGV